MVFLTKKVFSILKAPYDFADGLAEIVDKFPRVMRLALAILGVVWLMSLSVSFVLDFRTGMGGAGEAGDGCGSGEESASCSANESTDDSEDPMIPVTAELPKADVRLVANQQQYYVTIVTPSGDETLDHSEALNEDQLKEYLAERAEAYQFRRVVLLVSASYSAMPPDALFELVRDWGYDVQIDSTVDG